MSDVLFHGSPRKVGELKPRNEHGDPRLKSSIFATPSETFALAYAGKKWGDRDLEQSTRGGNASRMILREMRPGALKEIYGGRKGYVYEVPPESFVAVPGRRTSKEVVSTQPVRPIRARVIPNVLEALERTPDVELYKYDANAPETRIAIKRQVKRMSEMDDGGKGYLKWRLEPAPPETKQMFQEEMMLSREKRAGAPGHIYITGLPGAGKTTEGRRIAKETGLPLVSLDGIARDKGKAWTSSAQAQRFVDKHLDTPHVVEGSQILGFKEKSLRGNKTLYVHQPRDVILGRLVKRGLTNEKGTLLRGEKDRLAITREHESLAPVGARFITKHKPEILTPGFEKKAYDDTAVSGDPTKLMPRLRQIHKFSEFPTGLGPEDWDAMKQSPGKIKKAEPGPPTGVSSKEWDKILQGKRTKTKQAAGVMHGLFGSVPSMSEQYYMRGVGGETGDEENMPIELVSMAGPQAAQGAQMVQLARQLAERPNRRLVQRHLDREADSARIIEGLTRDLALLRMEKQGQAQLSDMEKEAATRQVKILRKLVASGNIDKARKMAKELYEAGVLKVSGPGTNLKRLGAGAEAVADLVVGAKAKPGKLLARKAFDPKGAAFSKEMMGEKVTAYRAIRGAGLEDDYAKLYGKLGKGGKGGRYLHTEYVHKPRPYMSPTNVLSSAPTSNARRARTATKRSGRVITPQDILAGREKKRAPIIAHLKSKGMSDSAARAKALEAYPVTGGAKLQDLHFENVADVGEWYAPKPKVLDFLPIPARRQAALDKAGKEFEANFNPKASLIRKKRDVAKIWEAQAGIKPSVEAIGHQNVIVPGAGPFGLPAPVTIAGGLESGPKSGREAVKRSLVGLGKGSRQAPKIRGDKSAPAARLTKSNYGDLGRLKAIPSEPVKKPGNVLPFVAGGIGAGTLGAGGYALHRRRNRELKKAASATIKTELLPHQERVIEKIKNRPGLVVAHGLGSGKTLSSIAAAVRLDLDKTQVLVPASLRANYQKEIDKHVTGDMPPIEVGSLQGAAGKGIIPDADLLIVDEAHRGRNPSSKTYQMIHGAKAKKRLLLTASPTYNSPADVAALVNMAAGGKILPSGAEFNKKYIAKPPGGIFGLLPFVRKQTELKNKGELKKTLSQWVDYHASGGEGFPDVTEERYSVKMTPRQTKLHDAAWGKLSLLSKMRLRRGLPPDKKDLSKINNFQSQTRQISNSEARYSTEKVEASPKVLKAVGLLDTEVKSNPNHRALVYSNYLSTLRDYSEELAKKKIPHAIFTGEQKMRDRKQMVEDYNSGKLKALLVSSAGGEGLDLKGTRQVQVLEPHWNVEKLKQVEGRAIRRGSHEHLPKADQHVTLQRFDAYPRGGIFKKRRGVEQVLGDMATNKERLNQELTGLLKSAYKLQGQTEVQGIPVAIENRKGSVRTGTDSDGNEWRTKMKVPYGYIKGTKGADGDEVDAFVGPDKEAPNAFVVHQHKDSGKGYDEDKVMLGFESKAEAKKAYLAHYDDPKYLGPIARVSTERLKELVASKKQLVKISQVSYWAMLDELMTQRPR
jgi:superfamily II DNA or RNA helicase